jgi:hypothetical protein
MKACPWGYSAISLVVVVGCGGVSTSLGDGGTDAAASDAGADGTASDSSTNDASGDAGMVSIQIGTCATFTSCGGNVSGTWAFSGGCVNDPLATSESLCPTLQVVSQTASATGTVTFTSALITRSYATSYTMDVLVPTACVLESCAEIQTGLSAYIPNAVCTAVSDGCSCTGSVTSAATQEASYSIVNDQIVTASGDHYAYCVTGTDMKYEHVSGPSPEVGTYDLTHQ